MSKINKIFLFFIISMWVFITGHKTFADVSSTKLAPEFTLTDTNGKAQSLSSFKGKYVVLEWTNPDCPFVKKHYDSGNMQQLQATYTAKDVIWLAINSSAAGKQGNYSSSEWNRIMKERKANVTAILLDPDGKVGKMYGAETTPHMFIVDPQGVLIYQGAIDNKPGTDIADISGATNYVRDTLEAVMAGKPVPRIWTKSYGCSVKY